MSDATRGIVHLTDADRKLLTAQIEGHADEVLDGVEVWEPAGLTHRPADPSQSGLGAEAVLLSIDGASDHRVALMTDRRHRVTGAAKGDTILYDGHGNKLHLSSSGAAFDYVGSTPATYCNVTADGTVDAARGFKVGGTPGENGILTITDTVTGGTAAIVITRGIITGITVLPPHTWAPIP